MGQLSYWHSVELSAGDRPTLRETEIDILVEDSVGLYQGKSKILKRQNGRLYLTSQRLIYIDNVLPRELSLSLELSDFKKIDYTSKFLKSSPKITIFFKSIKPSLDNNPRNKPSTTRTTTWICPICTFSNDVNLTTNYSNPQSLPACQTCGVKADSELIKSVIETAKSMKGPTFTTTSQTKPKQIECSACTFLNHASMRNCEICGSSLPMNAVNELTSDVQDIFDDRIKIETEVDDGLSDVRTPFIKISFHKGGDETFFERLQQTMEKLKWDTLVKRGNVNINGRQQNDNSPSPPLSNSSMSVGLNKLAQMSADQTRQNEEIINSSLDDLQTLLAKAHEIQSLIESFKRLQTGDSTSQAKIVPTINQVTQEVLTDPSKERQKRLYLQEISRQISEFLTNGTLDKEGGIITLMDLYALYNRGRVGFNLISPEQLYEACTYFSFLKLPLTLKKINKVLVVQDAKFQDTTQLVEEVQRFIEVYGQLDKFAFKFVQILKVSEFFNWSLSIAEEILKVCVDTGAVCVDQQVTGKNYYLNEFMIEEAQQLKTSDVIEIVEETQNDGNEAPLIPESVEGPVDQETPLIGLMKTDAPSTLLPTTFPEVPSAIPSAPDAEAKQKPGALMELEGLQF